MGSLRAYPPVLLIIAVASVVFVRCAFAQIPPESGICELLPAPNGGNSRAWGLTRSSWQPLAVCGDHKDLALPWQAVAWVREQPGGSWTAEVLPSIDPAQPGRGNDIIYDPYDLTFKACGFASDSLGQKRPVFWGRDGTPIIEWTSTILPTLIPGGEGEANGLLVTSDSVEIVVGWSMDDAEPPVTNTAADLAPGAQATRALVRKPVIWKRDGLSWLILQTGVYVLNLPGVALSVSADNSGLLRAVGWAVNTSGFRLPQVWESLDVGETWERTELPLPPGATEGTAFAVDHAGSDVVIVGAEPGHDVDAQAGGQALAWRPGLGGVWVVEEIGAASGSTNSVALGVDATGAPGPGYTAVGGVAEVTGDSAFYWHDEGVLNWGTVVSVCGESPPVVESLSTATAISSDGAHWVFWETDGGDTMAGILSLGNPTGVEKPPLASVLRLDAYPNPFRPDVRVAIALGEPGDVAIDVIDVKGRPVRTLFVGHAGAVERTVTWNGLADTGQPAASGIYFVRARTGGTTLTRKVVLLR